MMLNCRRASRLISDALDRELTLGERAALRFHLLVCTSCRNFGGRMRLLRRRAHDADIAP